MATPVGRSCRTMSGMGTKTDRVEARIEPGRAGRIRYASRLLHTSMSAFMADAAAERAEQVIADRAYTLVPDDYFEDLLAALDEPPAPIETLVAAAERTREAPAFHRG
jgi:uncharacterized protein (DUF1778 family)